jgi:hypothetical protein
MADVEAALSGLAAPWVNVRLRRASNSHLAPKAGAGDGGASPTERPRLPSTVRDKSVRGRVQHPNEAVHGGRGGTIEQKDKSDAKSSAGWRGSRRANEDSEELRRRSSHTM